MFGRISIALAKTDSGEAAQNQMGSGGIVPIEGTVYFGDITITVTTAEGSATVTAKTGA